MGVDPLRWVIEEAQAEGIAHHVLLVLAWHADNTTWEAWPTIDTLARETRYHRATIHRALNQLKDTPDLHIHAGGHGRGNRNTYQINPKESHTATLNQNFTVALRVAETPLLGSHCSDTEQSLTVIKNQIGSQKATLNPQGSQTATLNNEPHITIEAIRALRNGTKHRDEVTPDATDESSPTARSLNSRGLEDPGPH